MAIKLPDPGNGIPEQKTGNDEWTNMKIVRENFADQSNAASRLVGSQKGNVMEVGAFGLGETIASPYINNDTDISKLPNGFYGLEFGAHSGLLARQAGGLGYRRLCILGLPADPNQKNPFFYLIDTGNGTTLTSQAANKYIFYTTANVTKDGNGFLKGASPVVDLYDDKIELNRDAEQQGNITFEKVSTGNYLVKGSLGFAQEGWYIEMPKDANGNVLVAVVYEQLKNNDISVKTYAKRFDEETGDVVANLAKPRDIPAGRCINLRLHEVKEEIDEPAI